MTPDAREALLIVAIACYFTACAVFFVWLVFRPKEEDDEGQDV